MKVSTQTRNLRTLAFFLSLINGIWEDIDATDYNAAIAWLNDKGVQYVNREIPEDKHYENSMTLDIVALTDKDEVRRVSLRGTIGENVKMIARIDEFDHLYWVPKGSSVIFEYDDRPGVIGVSATNCGSWLNIGG